MRAVIVLMLLIAATPAWAEWVKVTEADTGTLYIDTATIRTIGDMRRIWELRDLKQRNSDGTMSQRVLEEYDCKEERRRLLAMSTHSGR